MSKKKKEVELNSFKEVKEANRGLNGTDLQNDGDGL